MLDSTSRHEETGARPRRSSGGSRPLRVLSLFGTRPEIIKMAPVVRALERVPRDFETLNIASGQHRELLPPFAGQLGVRLDADLEVGRPEQRPLEVCHRLLEQFAPMLRREHPDLLLVQGDTITAFAGALAAFHEGVKVGHIEAGLRSDDRLSPFPEEMNRRLLSQLADVHFAATPRNQRQLVAEGIDPASIVLTGNPVVDAVTWARQNTAPSERVRAWTDAGPERLILLTTHRRESFGAVMEARLEAIRDFVRDRADVRVLFSVHPNPEVRTRALRILGSVSRVVLAPPLDYFDFVHLMARSWLVVSDSGGVQEEACSLGRPLLVIRENTERPEAIEAGVAQLVGSDAGRLRALLDEAAEGAEWMSAPARADNPFGRGDAGLRIAAAIKARFGEGLREAASG